MQHHIIESATASLLEPVNGWYRTGIFIEKYYGEDSIPQVTVRKLARRIAKDLKRPFITAHKIMKYRVWNIQSGKWESLDEAEFSHYWIQFPKRKYLAPIYTPFLLVVADDRPAYRWGTPKKGSVGKLETPSLLSFSIANEQLWDEWYAAITTDPDMRKAMKLG